MNYLSSLNLNMPSQIRIQKSRWFLAAAIFHVLLTASVFFIGRAQILPDLFDTDGFGTFASDSREYLGEVKHLVEILRGEGVADWLQQPVLQWHNKLISLSFAILTPLFGFTILSAELYNLVCYLVILFLIFTLGSEVYNDETGVIAAVVVSLWPSFLLHTTQLLNDGLFIAGFLALVLISARWFYREHSPASALAHIAIAVLVAIILGWMRPGWPIIFLAVFLLNTLGLFIQVGIKRRYMLWNLVGSMLVLGVTLAITFSNITVLANSYQPSSPPHEEELTSKDAHPQLTQDERDEHPVKLWAALLHAANSASQIIGGMRQTFVEMYPYSGSKVDAQYRITSTKDLVCYLPRAAEIGFFAPFPNMWMRQGEKLGLSARLISGVETLIMYLIYFFAALGVWRARRGVSVWYLLIVIILGVTSLGLVVVVIGALYRMRYVYWMLMILLGAGGIQGVIKVLLGQILVID